MKDSNSNISEQIRNIDIQLEKLEKNRAQLLQEKSQLEKQLCAPDKDNQNKFSSKQKINIFTSLFKGRADVFASRWENKHGKCGYSVACHNEWVKGICEKPRIKCSYCPKRKYKALDQQGQPFQGDKTTKSDLITSLYGS